MQDKISICRTLGIFVVRILFSLLRFTGHLSDRLKVFAGQNENLPVSSGSPVLFVKTAIVVIILDMEVLSMLDLLPRSCLV